VNITQAKNFIYEFLRYLTIETKFLTFFNSFSIFLAVWGQGGLLRKSEGFVWITGFQPVKDFRKSEGFAPSETLTFLFNTKECLLYLNIPSALADGSKRK